MQSRGRKSSENQVTGLILDLDLLFLIFKPCDFKGGGGRDQICLSRITVSQTGVRQRPGELQILYNWTSGTAVNTWVWLWCWRWWWEWERGGRGGGGGEIKRKVGWFTTSKLQFVCVGRYVGKRNEMKWEPWTLGPRDFAQIRAFWTVLVRVQKTNLGKKNFFILNAFLLY